MNDYWLLAGFDAVYLEDSFVLDIVADLEMVRLKLVIVLRETHPLYEQPRAQEQYCYWDGDITFDGASKVVWAGRGARPAVDARGELDYGNIDYFRLNGDLYELRGEWGSLEIASSRPPRLELRARTVAQA